MKKILITSFLILISVSGFSQEEELLTKRKTRIGFTVGVNKNYYRLTNDINNVINHDTSLLYGGIFVETPLSRRLSLQTEVLYSHIESEDYFLFEVPVFLKYRLDEKWSIHVGAQMNYFYNGTEDPDFAREIANPITFGLSLGIEYEFNDRWSMYLRYTHRFTKNIHPELGNINGFKLGVAYRF